MTDDPKTIRNEENEERRWAKTEEKQR